MLEELKLWFKDLKTIKEGKTLYKDMAKTLHPDKGGSDEDFKALNSAYNYFLDNFSELKNNSVFESEEEKENFNMSLELEKIIASILHYENITIEVVGSWIWVCGDSKEIKDTLKNLGFRWASKKRMWYFGERKGKKGKEMSFDSIKERYKSTKVQTKQTKKIS